MSGPELKNCPDGCHTDFITMQQVGMRHFMRCDCGWSAPIRANKERAIAAWNLRTPDPAQIRSDALREALEIANKAVAKRTKQIEEERKKPTNNISVPQIMRWRAGKLQAELIADEIAALLDTPLSPTAVDGSIAPDAGTKGADQ